jgi:hypothetical protein
MPFLLVIVPSCTYLIVSDRRAKDIAPYLSHFCSIYVCGYVFRHPLLQLLQKPTVFPPAPAGLQ